MSEILNELQEVKKAAQDQTAASQAMTNEVSGKMAQIDTKLAELVKDVPDAIDSEMYKSIYVSVDGDDNNHGGSSAAPLASIAKAISLIPNGSTARILLASAPVESPDNVYDVEQVHELESRHVLIAPYGGSQVTLRFMDGGAFNTRSGGSIKVGNPYHLTVEVVASRTKDSLIYQYGGDVSFGGFYTTKLVNHSSSLKMISKIGFHVGDNKVGSTFGRVSFMRFDVSESTETDFLLVDIYLGGLALMSIYSVTLGGNAALYSPSRQALPVGANNNAYLITY
jgi:hypothetical protein